MSSFVIIKKTNRGIISVCRRHIGDFRAVDFWGYVSRQYDGRFAAGSSLVFESKEETKRFAEHNKELLQEVEGPVFVCKYDPCLNHIQVNASEEVTPC